jgi:S-formylglutathione hydrolase FrmB
MNKFKVLVLWAFISAHAFSVNAQVSTTANPTEPTADQSKVNSNSTAQNFKLASKSMNREMPYQVILPTNYESAKDKRFAVVYLLHGLFGHFNNWSEKTKLSDYAKNYEYIRPYA